MAKGNSIYGGSSGGSGSIYADVPSGRSRRKKDKSFFDRLGAVLSGAGHEIAGIGPGFYGMGRAFWKDVTDKGLYRGHSYVYHDIVKPIGQSYAYKYGPLFAHGNFGETLHRMGETPIGTLADIATPFTLGTAAAVKAPFIPLRAAPRGLLLRGESALLDHPLPPTAVGPLRAGLQSIEVPITGSNFSRYMKIQARKALHRINVETPVLGRYSETRSAARAIKRRQNREQRVYQLAKKDFEKSFAKASEMERHAFQYIQRTGGLRSELEGIKNRIRQRAPNAPILKTLEDRDFLDLYEHPNKAVTDILDAHTKATRYFEKLTGVDDTERAYLTILLGRGYDYHSPIRSKRIDQLREEIRQNNNRILEAMEKVDEGEYSPQQRAMLEQFGPAISQEAGDIRLAGGELDYRRWQEQLAKLDRDLAKTEKSLKLTRNQRWVLQELKPEHRKPVTLEDIIAKTGLSKSAVNRALTDLQRKGHAKKTDRGIFSQEHPKLTKFKARRKEHLAAKPLEELDLNIPIRGRTGEVTLPTGVTPQRAGTAYLRTLLATGSELQNRLHRAEANLASKRGVSIEQVQEQFQEGLYRRDRGVEPRVVPVDKDYTGMPMLRMDADEYAALMPKGEYVYHSTSPTKFKKIVRAGLKPGRRREGEPTGVYFADDGTTVASLRPIRNENEVILRVKRDAVALQDTGQFEKGWQPTYPEGMTAKDWEDAMRATSTGEAPLQKQPRELPEFSAEELVSKQTVPARAIEYLGEDGQWHPITGRIGTLKPASEEIPLVRAELEAQGLPEPVYVPDRAVEEKAGSFAAAGATPKGELTLHTNKGLLQLMGMAASDINVISPEFFRKMQWLVSSQANADLQALARAAKPGYEINHATEQFVRKTPGEKISFMENVGYEFAERMGEESTKRSFFEMTDEKFMEKYGIKPSDKQTMEEGGITGTAEDLVTDSPELAATDANGYRLVVNKKVASEIIGEYVRQSSYARIFYNNPTMIWRALVLNLRMGWLVNNIIGNFLMYAVANAGHEGRNALQRAEYMVRERTLRPQFRGSVSEEFLGRRPELAEQLTTFGGSHIPDVEVQNRIGRAAMSLLQGRYSPARLTRRADIFVEQRLRRRMVTNHLRKNKEFRRIYNSLPKQTKRFDAAAEEFAKGNLKELELISKEVNDAMGNFFDMGFAERTALRSVFPFYAWYKAIVGVTLRMPLDHPARALILAKVGQIGQEIQADDYGLSYLNGSISLPGGYQLKTKQMNPWATVPQLGSAAIGAGGGLFPFLPGLSDVETEQLRDIGGTLNPWLTIPGALAAMGQEGPSPFLGPWATIRNLPLSRLASPYDSSLYRGDTWLGIGPDRWREIMSYMGFPAVQVNPQEARARANREWIRVPVTRR